MKVTITLNGEQIKSALLKYIEETENFDVSGYSLNPDFAVVLDSTDKLSANESDTIALEFEKQHITQAINNALDEITDEDLED